MFLKFVLDGSVLPPNNICIQQCKNNPGIQTHSGYMTGFYFYREMQHSGHVIRGEGSNDK